METVLPLQWFWIGAVAKNGRQEDGCLAWCSSLSSVSEIYACTARLGNIWGAFPE